MLKRLSLVLTVLLVSVAIAQTESTATNTTTQTEGAAPQIEGTEYYFIANSVTQPPAGPVASLIEIMSDSLPLTPPGYTPITLDAIHEMGLQSPFEAESAAYVQGCDSGGTVAGLECKYRSWITKGYVGSGSTLQKTVTCGSKTQRDIYPGYVAVDGYTYEDIYTQKWFQPAIVYYCWYSCWFVNTWAYSANETHQWDQYGYHRFAPAGPIANSHVGTWY